MSIITSTSSDKLAMWGQWVDLDLDLDVDLNSDVENGVKSKALFRKSYTDEVDNRCCMPLSPNREESEPHLVGVMGAVMGVMYYGFSVYSWWMGE